MQERDSITDQLSQPLVVDDGLLDHAAGRRSIDAGEEL